MVLDGIPADLCLSGSGAGGLQLSSAPLHTLPVMSMVCTGHFTVGAEGVVAFWVDAGAVIPSRDGFLVME